MEPDRQAEIQLGHMCNNRCVFCVSGQRTEMREAFPLPTDPLLASIRELYEQGTRKLTILGGEPTLQPGFLEALRYAVSLGFEEIVLFTNGVKTARAAYVDELLAIAGDRLSFRLSFQGATKAAHEGTTKKRGSFGKLVESLENLRARGRRISVNMCVVRSNFESVDAFPALLSPYGVRQLHLDMVRPLDAGVRSDEEMRDMLPRYTDLAPHLARMVAGFPDGFDVNIGNLPFCVAPQLSRWIHHDGESTLTVAVDHADALSEPWDKYEVKRRDKLKPPGCATCVFDPQCNGVFETYRDVYGLDELTPITPERLLQLDPERRLFTLHFHGALRRLAKWCAPEPFGLAAVRVNSIDHDALLSFAGPGGMVRVALRRPGGGIASTDAFSLHLLETPDLGPAVRGLLRALFAEAREATGSKVIHPVGDDAVFLGERPPRLGALLDPRLGPWLRRLRAHAPFGPLDWRDVSLGAAGQEAHLRFTDPEGREARVTLAARGPQLGASYALGAEGTPSDALRQGLAEVFRVLRTPS